MSKRDYGKGGWRLVDVENHIYTQSSDTVKDLCRHIRDLRTENTRLEGQVKKLREGLGELLASLQIDHNLSGVTGNWTDVLKAYRNAASLLATEPAGAGEGNRLNYEDIEKLPCFNPATEKPSKHCESYAHCHIETKRMWFPYEDHGPDAKMKIVEMSSADIAKYYKQFPQPDNNLEEEPASGGE